MSKHIIAISWNHVQTPIDFRDKLVLSQKEIQQCVHLLIDNNEIIEIVALSTCNRIEFYAFAKQSIDIVVIIKNIYTEILKRDIPWSKSEPEIYVGMEAVQHICRVASGIESMVFGEMQILSQVKAAHQALIQSQPDADVLNKLFSIAVHCAEAVRNDSHFSKCSTSISELAVQVAQQIFLHLEQKTILIVGAGKMADITACYFKKAKVNKIIIANRSERPGKALAKSIAADYINLHQLNDIIHECDAIVTVTHAREYLIERKHIENIMNNRKRSLLLLDISTPRNINPSSNEIDNVYLYDLDDLKIIAAKNRTKNNKTIAKAKIIIQNYSQKVMNWLQVRDLNETDLELAEEMS